MDRRIRPAALVGVIMFGPGDSVDQRDAARGRAGDTAAGRATADADAEHNLRRHYYELSTHVRRIAPLQADALLLYYEQ